MKALINRISLLLKNKKARPVLVIGVIMLFGGLVITLTLASGFSFSIEPELDVKYPVTVHSDSSTSGGKYIKFGAESGPNNSGRGPTGQWPEGFPDYETQANIVTNGSVASLQNALNSLGSSGGVIEHPGDIPAADLTRPNGPEIVIRPPIGKRAEYTTAANPRSSNLLLAGWVGTNMTIKGEGTEQIYNSGWAWCEATSTAGVNVFSGDSARVEGIFYEIVFNEYGRQIGDRGGTRSSGNSWSLFEMYGSILTGSLDAPGDHPDYPNTDYHADTLQVYFPAGSSGKIIVHDSVLYGSWDKMYQGVGSTTAEFYNVYAADPIHSRQIYQGPSDLSSLGKYGINTAGPSLFVNSTYVGSNNPSYNLQIKDSEYFKLMPWNNYTEIGINTELSSIPSPPPTPSHEQLDDIWSD